MWLVVLGQRQNPKIQRDKAEELEKRVVHSCALFFVHGYSGISDQPGKPLAL